MHDIQTELSKRILILDGAMGTMLQRKGLQGNSESFNLTNPETISEIHNEYIEAGADIITANSFSANSISQSEYNLSEKAGQMAEAAARIARKAADEAPRKIWVAGSVGPTSKSLSLAQNINDPIFRPYSFDGMAEAFEVQIRGLVKGLMIESYIEDGNQPVGGGCYGKSITDPCLGWEKSERLIYEIADLL